MALTECTIEGCGRKFRPGNGGANGLCTMHLRRRALKSPNALVPGKVKDGSQTEQLITYVSKETMARVNLVVAGRAGVSHSQWLRELIENAVGLKAEPKP